MKDYLVAGAAVIIAEREADPDGVRYQQGPDIERKRPADRVGGIRIVEPVSGFAGPIYVVEMIDGKRLRLRAEHIARPANFATTRGAVRDVDRRATEVEVNPEVEALPVGTHVRVLDTDLRAIVRGATGRIIGINMRSRDEKRISYRLTLDKAPEGYGADGWAVFGKDVEVIEPATLPESVRPAATFGEPGFYTVTRGTDGELRVDSFTSSAILSGPEEPAGVWVASHMDADHLSTVIVDSIHEEEVEAYRALDLGATRPRVTHVEFGAPVERIVRETHGL